MFGLIPRKVRLEFDASVESVEAALQIPQIGMRARVNGRRCKIVHDPGLQQPVSVIEGKLIYSGSGCVLDGKIRWSRVHQFFLLISLIFLVAFCFGIPALMIRSFLLGTMRSSIGHPLCIPFIWAVVTWLPFFFFFKFIFKSRLPEIERHLGRMISSE
jgi:hypothetical protein